MPFALCTIAMCILEKIGYTGRKNFRSRKFGKGTTIAFDYIQACLINSRVCRKCFRRKFNIITG